MWSKDLATRLENLKEVPHVSDADKFEASHNKYHRRWQCDQPHVRRDRRSRGYDHEREQDYYCQGIQSPTSHEQRLFRNIKLDSHTFDGCLDS